MLFYILLILFILSFIGSIVFKNFILQILSIFIVFISLFIIIIFNVFPKYYTYEVIEDYDVFKNKSITLIIYDKYIYLSQEASFMNSDEYCIYMKYPFNFYGHQLEEKLIGEIGECSREILNNKGEN